jgi:hypothetical protein
MCRHNAAPMAYRLKLAVLISAHPKADVLNRRKESCPGSKDRALTRLSELKRKCAVADKPESYSALMAWAASTFGMRPEAEVATDPLQTQRSNLINLPHENVCAAQYVCRTGSWVPPCEKWFS